MADAAAQQNPLDVLEELLKNKGGQTDDDKAAAQVAAEQAAKEAEVARLAEAQKREQEAAAKLLEEQAKLKQMNLTPEYQARVQQDEALKAGESQKQADLSGHEIRQLEHSTINTD